MVVGIGIVEGIESMIIAHDPTVRGGASNPYTFRKVFRGMAIARENRLPIINIVESGGADLPTQAEIFVPGGQLFHDLTQHSAAGLPTVALVFGNSTAGGAYIPGMCDYVVMVRNRSKVFLGGPPLVKMATGEVSDDESLGGADMHARTSGLADFMAEDEQDAIRVMCLESLTLLEFLPEPESVYNRETGTFHPKMTLGQLRRQREQLEQSADLAGDTRRVTRDARRTLKAIAWKVFREKLTLIGTIACLLAIDFALAYRLVSNHGRL